MKSENGVTHITPSDGNVFEDLGFDAVEAIALQHRSQKIINEKKAIKVTLMESQADLT